MVLLSSSATGCLGWGRLLTFWRSREHDFVRLLPQYGSSGNTAIVRAEFSFSRLSSLRPPPSVRCAPRSVRLGAPLEVCNRSLALRGTEDPWEGRAAVGSAEPKVHMRRGE